MPIPILWTYHLFYGDKEKFSWVKLLAQALLVTFILLFMTWDREQVKIDSEKHAAAEKLKRENPYGIPINRGWGQPENERDEES